MSLVPIAMIPLWERGVPCIDEVFVLLYRLGVEVLGVVANIAAAECRVRYGVFLVHHWLISLNYM